MPCTVEHQGQGCRSGARVLSRALGEGEEAVVRTCQAGKELLVVFLQGAKCEKQSLHPKQRLTELEQ